MTLKIEENQVFLELGELSLECVGFVVRTVVRIHVSGVNNIPGFSTYQSPPSVTHITESRT